MLSTKEQHCLRNPGFLSSLCYSLPAPWEDEIKTGQVSSADTEGLLAQLQSSELLPNRYCLEVSALEGFSRKPGSVSAGIVANVLASSGSL